MGDPNFYQILGVGRLASAEQIKSAHRNLVKRNHPDLFLTTEEKAKATEKLRSINEAYAVLGNAERRRRYDEEFAQKTRIRAGAAVIHQRTVRPRHRQADARHKPIKKPKISLRISKKWAGYSLAAVTALALFVYAGSSEPRLTLKWELWEKLKVLPMQRHASMEPGKGCVRLSQYGSVAECSAILRKMVQEDERTGSSAVFDEKNGTMAITMHIMKALVPGSNTTVATDGATKRERNQE